MSSFVALAVMASSAGSPFVGEWACQSANSNDPFSLTLVVTEGEAGPSASISRSTHLHLPDGAVRLRGKPEKLDNPSGSPLIPDQRWEGEVRNNVGVVGIGMLWRRTNDGLFVGLWQYFSDGSPSKSMGALVCTGVEA